ncbi:MAG TPA: DUF72 domain-containing protein [Polyangiaceae bacterium]|jgi:uncharacterized protein YecE (DUF72 family)
MTQDNLSLAETLAAAAAEPAVIDNVLVGSAGWTDRTLIESSLFYPKGAKTPQARLAHYAKAFSLVEVDASYYTLLPPETVARWVSWTPERFRFDVKAHPVLTGHPIDVSRLPSDLKGELVNLGFERRVYADRLPQALREEMERRFFASVEPLVLAQRLGAVLLQFPPWFVATRRNAARIEELAELWSKVPFSVEFRHSSWLLPERRERVFDLLKRRRLSYVCVDEPQAGPVSVPPATAVTNPELALVRFHGKNLKGWTRRGATVQERFDYVYSPDELREWVAPIRLLAQGARAVHAIFNNCVRNYAVVNAKGLSVLLSQDAGLTHAF